MKSIRPGRYIWQLADADRLLVAWRAVDDGVATVRADEIDRSATSWRCTTASGRWPT